MKSWLLIFFLLFGFTSWAQTPKKTAVDLESFIERLFPIQEEDIDYEAIYEQLFQLYQNPINLNKADLEVLQASYLLTPNQINQLIQYRYEFGDFLSLYELQAIPDFDLTTIENLIPFVTLDEIPVKPKPFLQRIKEEENAYLLLRNKRTWEQRKGYTAPDTSSTGKLSTRYLGDPNEIYLRFRIQHARDFSLGVTLEKDPGEQFIWDQKTKRYGFNFLSFHLTKYQLGNWKTIALGDFQASFGQGLVFGAGYTLGKGAETVPTVRRSSIGILPYTAALEYGFFRGIGVTRKIRNWQVTLIGSRVPRDGSISSSLDSLESSQDILTSLSQTGLHRTPSELSIKGQLNESNLGGNIQFSSPSGRWMGGANFLHTSFSIPWVRTASVYNQFEFSGKSNQVGSAYFNYNWKNFFFFGESAMSANKGIGTVLGFVSSLSKQVDFSLLWRNYSKDFHSFYSSGFAENTRPINEKGLYMGIQIKPNSIWKVNAYYDAFSFPWLKYRVYAPSKGYEWLGRLTYQPRRNFIAFVQLRQEEKARNLSDSGEPQLTYQVLPMIKTNGLISLENQLTKQVFIRSRILWSQVEIQNQKTSGIMIYQDLQVEKGNWRWTGRIGLFDTETYDNRLYAFENNVLWTFSIPAFSGRGIRYYLLAQRQIGNRTTVYFRFSRTSYTDRETVSSGLQEIKVPHQSDTAFLIRYALK